jgi:hypothetical protein
VPVCALARAGGPYAAWLALDAQARPADPDVVGFLVVILTLALIGLVAAVVSAPVRRARSAAESAPAVDTPQRADDVPSPSQPHKRDEMEAAREAKYREIRDTELDFRTGKLSSEDYQSIDADLRAEAIEILNELDELKPKDA